VEALHFAHASHMHFVFNEVMTGGRKKYCQCDTLLLAWMDSQNFHLVVIVAI
jgi:hypothetical protein